MEPKPRIALLIDADNAQAARIDLVLNELSSYGESNIRRAYGDWTVSNLKGWSDILHEKAIRPIHQPAYTKGKNASDIALAVDAIDLWHTDKPEAFALVSSDADFTPLVTILRQRGAAVYGFGETKTPSAFATASSKFLYVDQLVAEGDSGEGTQNPAVVRLQVPTTKLKQDTTLVTLLRTAISGTTDENGWATIGWLGHRISNQSSFDSRNYGYPSLSKLLKATDLFEFRDEGTSAVAVRDKRRAKQARP